MVLVRCALCPIANWSAVGNVPLLRAIFRLLFPVGSMGIYFKARASTPTYTIKRAAKELRAKDPYMRMLVEIRGTCFEHETKPSQELLSGET